MTPNFTSHVDVLRRLFDVSGKAVADIGAGAGDFARELAADGARVSAVEIDAARFDAGDDGAAVTYLEGRGEDLPFTEGTLDLVTFVFSFHHVPQDHQGDAIAETKRVLQSAGRLHVVEPLPDCRLCEVVAPLDDETDILNRSRRLLEAMDGKGFQLLRQVGYSVPYRYRSADDLIDSIVEVEPDRAALVPAVKDEVARRFERFATPDGDDLLFEQPCIGFHFRVA